MIKLDLDVVAARVQAGVWFADPGLENGAAELVSDDGSAGSEPSQKRAPPRRRGRQRSQVAAAVESSPQEFVGCEECGVSWLACDCFVRELVQMELILECDGEGTSRQRRRHLQRLAELRARYEAQRSDRELLASHVHLLAGGARAL